MNGKRSLIVALACTLIATAGMVGYSWKQNLAAENRFVYAGYVLTTSPEEESKQKKFSAEAPWKKDIEEDIVFPDIQGDSVKVPQDSFVHYDNEGMSAFAKGVVVDTSDVESLKVTNHYAITPDITFSANSGGYIIENTDLEKEFLDFIWKVNENKYMIVSPTMSASFSEEDVRTVDSYVEVNYVDNGIIQLQTSENVWQTISDECVITLENGKKVNLSLKNVTDENNVVLMDLGKMVIDSNDNIEVIPLTDELKELKEDTIPRFDITAENGQNGIAGTIGTNGQSGNAGDAGDAGDFGDDGGDGNEGDEGDSGGAGSAGSSGQNGKAGAPGSSGSNGAPGGSQDLGDKVLEFPIFLINNWTVSSTSASGKITVKDDGTMLLSNSEELKSKVYVVDNSTSEIVETIHDFDFASIEADGYTFEFKNLKPDKEYRLVVDAPINTGLEGANDYMRNFISKTFWTDSTGVYMEVSDRTTNSLSISVNIKDYAGTVNSAEIYLYGNLSAAKSASVTNLGNIHDSKPVVISDSKGKVNFDQLITSDTTYYARIISISGGTKTITDQVLEITTLKKMATLGTPTIVANRDNWGFDVTPGSINDPDSGIYEFVYEFYNNGDIDENGSIKNGAKAVKIVTASSTQGITVPLDGENLDKNKEYKVRLVARFNDNEKDVQLTSRFSNVASVSGSKLPMVYFVNEGTGSSGGASTPTDTSAWYDQIYGSLIVAPGAEGGKVLIDQNHIPTVTVRAPGYYYAQFPVYLGTNAPNDGSSYLVATMDTAGFIKIEIPNKALTASGVNSNGAINGLRPKTQYSLILNGDLSDDGTNATDPNVKIGTTVVTTPNTVGIGTKWVDDAAQVVTKFKTNLKFTSANTGETEVTTKFNRQMTTLASMDISLVEGSKNNPGKELGKITVTEANFQKALGTKADSLGKAMEEGIDITEATLNVKDTSLQGIGIVHLKIDKMYDYTIKSENRINQKDYKIDEDPTTPPSGSSGAIYINEFKAANPGDELHDIKLQPSPDPLPPKGGGFTTITKNADGSYSLTPNYKNTSNLAQEMTFFAFDYPDFHKPMKTFIDENTWEVDQTQYKGNNINNVTLGATTAVKRSTQKGLWLGKVSVEIPNTGKMPKLRFYPKTVETFYAEKYPNDPAAAAVAVGDYQPGRTTDSTTKEYIFFYNDDHNGEPATGHQFVFAWTMKYGIDKDNIFYYPFEVVAGECEYDNIPHSGAQDSPFENVRIYALPWKIDAKTSTGTWAMYAHDKDGAIQKDANNKAALYRRTSSITGTPIKTSKLNGNDANINIYKEAPLSIAGIRGTDDANMVDIYESKGSVPGAVKVQWYTNKYTENGGGIFVSNGQYLPSTIEKSGKKVSENGTTLIPYFETAFTWYNEDNQFEAVDGSVMKVALKEVPATSGGDSIIRYDATIEGHLDNLKKLNGFRFKFKPKDGGKEVVTDKYLEGIDYASISDVGNSQKISFHIGLSRELGDVAGKNVALSVIPLYENGEEGFGYKGPVSLKNYLLSSKQGIGIQYSPYGYTSFSAQGKLQMISSNDVQLSKLGSFFSIEEMSMTKLSVASTRNTNFTPLNDIMDISISGRGVSNGLYGLIPRVLVEGTRTYTSSVTIWDKDSMELDDNDFKIPTITPVISYYNSAAGANSIESEFTVSGLPLTTTNKGTWMLLEKKNSEGNWVVQKKSGTTWEAVESADIVNPNIENLVQYSKNPDKFIFTGLESDKDYRVMAYYYDTADSKFKKMNMLNASGAEQTNEIDLKTSQEPIVKLKAVYESSFYDIKRLYVGASVTNALDFYYTVALEKHEGEDWSHLTYLDWGDSLKAIDGIDEVYQVGAIDSKGGLDDTKHHNNGFVRQQKFMDGELVPEDESKIGLIYGADYRVRVRVYNNGTGPRAGESEDSGNLVISESGKEKAVFKFKVTDTKDDTYLNSSFSLGSSGDNPTVTFTPVYARKSSTLRKDKFAVVVTRTREVDGKITVEDVTDRVRSSTGESIHESPLILTKSHNITIDKDIMNDVKDGDKFICYTYAVQDDIDNVDTKGSGDVNRADILAGRTVDGETTLTVPSVEVKGGKSILLNEKTQVFKTAQTSAGAINVTKTANLQEFKVTMDKPVNISSISHISWTVNAVYTNDEDVTVTESVSGIHEELRVNDAGNNIYEYSINPKFSTNVDPAKVGTYTVSIQFYKKSVDDIFESNDITLTAANEDGTVTQQVDGGLRFSIAILLDDTIMNTMLLPEMGFPIPPLDGLLPDEILPPEEVIPPVEGGDTEVIPPVEGGDTEVIPPVEGGDTEVIPPVEGGDKTLPDSGVTTEKETSTPPINGKVDAVPPSNGTKEESSSGLGSGGDDDSDNEGASNE